MILDPQRQRQRVAMGDIAQRPREDLEHLVRQCGGLDPTSATPQLVAHLEWKRDSMAQIITNSTKTSGSIVHPVKTFYTRDAHQVANLLARLSNSVVGLDLEWKPTFTRGDSTNKVALMQIYDGKICLLLHIFHFDHIPDALVEWLDSDKILKTGVGMHNDVTKMKSDYQVRIRSTVAVDRIAKHYMSTCSGLGWGLQSLARNVLGLEVSKSKRTVLSNWQCKDLSSKQLRYAVEDATISYNLFERLHHIYGPNENIAEFVVNAEAVQGIIPSDSHDLYAPSRFKNDQPAYLDYSVDVELQHV